MFSLFKQALHPVGQNPALPSAVPTIKQPPAPQLSLSNHLNPTPLGRFHPTDTSWTGKVTRDAPIWGYNAQLDRNAAGLIQYGDDGKMKFDFNPGKIKKWIGNNSGTLKSLLPYGAALLGVGMITRAIGNKPTTQVNVQYPTAIPGMNRARPQGQGTLFPNEQ